MDVKTIAKETLRGKISKLLEGKAFQQALLARGMETDNISESKQTDTTQRWKISLKIADIALPLPTKIEFSRRKMDESTLFEPIDTEIIQHHQLYPILTNHYTQESAFCQKVDALIHRTEVQARDVFDLQLLLNRGVQPRCLPDFLCKKLDTAIGNALSVSFSDFKAQVVAYLMEEYQDYYSSTKVWNDIQAAVVSKLEEIK